jgi:NTP pyrophosphatase (non-canonical NTP hydrolase)
VSTDEALERIRQERQRQFDKWGDQSHHEPLYWLGILVEEVGEIAKAMIEERDPAAITTEIVHAAAVACQMIEAAATWDD